ncbi:uncharacterized protein LOC130933302 isoform X3 [Arachis stenosperma]|uniref:uncharacterized protein LOC130933302 isoform X3 n=1 Tax=Arachis stenosperma TaxID=217475 RepID=UPI0025AB8724|nr:uncharacterized protein LOC130933302 isoform X3 [Arachis stenosperma]
MQQLMLWRKAMVNIMFLLLLLMDRFPEIQIQEDAKGLVYKNKQLLILWLLQDGPWDEMQQFDNNITEPLFDNVQEKKGGPYKASISLMCYMFSRRCEHTKAWEGKTQWICRIKWWQRH